MTFIYYLEMWCEKKTLLPSVVLILLYTLFASNQICSMVFLLQACTNNWSITENKTSLPVCVYVYLVLKYDWRKISELGSSLMPEEYRFDTFLKSWDEIWTSSTWFWSKVLEFSMIRNRIDGH